MLPGTSRGPRRDRLDPFDLLERFLGLSPRTAASATERAPIGRLLSDSARELTSSAARRAADDGSADLDTDHLLWAATRVEPSRSLLAKAGVEPDRLAAELAEALPIGELAEGERPQLTPAAKRALSTAHTLARSSGASYIGPQHILSALVEQPGSAAIRALTSHATTPDALRTTAEPTDRGAKAPTLDEYGCDLTEEARAGRLDPVVGRADEIEQTVEILSRRSRNNPVLIGEPGVGKTAVVEGLAQRIADGDVPESLANKPVVQLDLVGLAAGAKHRGEFEERIKKVLDEGKATTGGLILFIDEVHTAVGAGSGREGAMDAGNTLKRALVRGELHLVGATTVDKYRRHLEKDPAVERLIQPVLVREPTVEETVRILEGLRDVYEAHHQVRYYDDALVAAAELTDRYISDRFLPEKAIDLTDQAGARVRLRSLARGAELTAAEARVDKVRREKDQAVADEDYGRAEELKAEIFKAEEELSKLAEKRAGVAAVTADDIAALVSSRTGIPVEKLAATERERLLKLEEALHARVVGQDEAITAVCEAVRRSRSGLGDPDRPVGSFLFLGPTGVGRTELAKALAEVLFGDEDRLIRIDMNEYQERQTVSRLVGAPPGYTDHEEAGLLTDAVRRKPYCVLLFDEIEKAHPDAFNVLLRILEDGRLTDAQGGTVEFRTTVVIMTSYVGARRIQDLADRPIAAIRDVIQPELESQFRPEFLNRIDDIVVFHPLSRDHIAVILDMMLERSRRRLRAQDLELEVTEAARQWLAGTGYQPEAGARPLRRVIQTELDNRVASLLLSGVAEPGDTVIVAVVDGTLSCAVRRPEKTS
ncbi:ATP-dependent Clp protease ATP-binding subunit [Streptantibioticus ferralitis]|uniref:ATP-dependent Clp protease ATP-binding subunit n=1 Tax=Streptantibioticus ferralitis TaxID=236510 RepID=A0ABT5YSX7_9ACTN|nr:ATP-dependent Clp protease ATP-binding subunit [Streptantibioticus ferralitis]MDF2254529.1 ATP-dependent Clp protease ATP-binding subunit [Streptantibioticus ferralitis]